MGRFGWIKSKHLSTQLAVNPSPISSQTSCTFRHMNPLWHTGVQHVHLRYDCNLAFDYWLHCDIRNKTSMLCNSNLWNSMHKKTAGNYFKHNLQDMLLSAPWLQTYLMCRKYLFIKRLYASVERGHTFRYIIPSWTRRYIISSPAGREVSVCIHHWNASYHKNQIRERGRPLQLPTDRRWRDRTC